MSLGFSNVVLRWGSNFPSGVLFFGRFMRRARSYSLGTLVRDSGVFVEN